MYDAALLGNVTNRSIAIFGRDISQGIAAHMQEESWASSSGGGGAASISSLWTQNAIRYFCGECAHDCIGTEMIYRSMCCR